MEKLLHVLFACHRIPERSFFFRGKQFPICARCTGILIGYLFGFVYFLLFGTISFLFALLLLVPLMVDGFGQFVGKWESTNVRRLFTGLSAGIATDFIVYWLIVYGITHGRQLGKLLLGVI